MARRKYSENPSQRDFRRYIRFKDQHQRPWECVVEDSTLAPVGAPAPLVNRKTGKRLWTAPTIWMGNQMREFLPPPNFFRYSEMDVGTFFIDYQSWYDQQVVRSRDWLENQLHFYAQQLYGERWYHAIRKPPAELMRIVGEKPFDPLLIKAAQKGNRWILGLPLPDGTARAMPEWAKPIWANPPLVETDQAYTMFPDAEDEGGEPAEVEDEDWGFNSQLTDESEWAETVRGVNEETFEGLDDDDALSFTPEAAAALAAEED